MTGAIGSLHLPGRVTQAVEPAPSSAAVPLALPVLRTAFPGSLYFGTARMDSSGRVHDRSAVAVLGWLHGDRLMITVVETSVVYQRRAEGVFAMTAKPYVVVPAAVRARCGLGAGSRVLVATDPAQDALVVHPPGCGGGHALPLPHRARRRWTRVTDSTATTAELAAARLLLARMGIDPVGLVASATGSPGSSTPVALLLEAWIPVVAGLVSPSTARSYGSYWKKALAEWPDRRLDQITASEIKAMSEKVKATALVRSNSRGGRTAAENFIAAMRCLYRHAENDGTIDERRNPARRVTKPRRNKSTRRALPDARIAELNDVVSSTGDDPELDALIVRLHEETACRRGGALGLRPRDLDREQCLIYLREKDETSRWQPVSPTLMRHLLAQVEERGTGHREDQLLRYANGDPITRRRHDYIWKRVRHHLDWADRLQISAHWLRHTTLTWVERNFGYAHAGHRRHRQRHLHLHQGRHRRNRHRAQHPRRRTTPTRPRRLTTGGRPHNTGRPPAATSQRTWDHRENDVRLATAS